MYGLAVDDWESMVAQAHATGDGHVVLNALNGLPALPSDRIYRFTAVSSPGMPTETILESSRRLESLVLLLLV